MSSSISGWPSSVVGRLGGGYPGPDRTIILWFHLKLKSSHHVLWIPWLVGTAQVVLLKRFTSVVSGEHRSEHSEPSHANGPVASIHNCPESQTGNECSAEPGDQDADDEAAEDTDDTRCVWASAKSRFCPFKAGRLSLGCCGEKPSTCSAA